MSRRPDAVTSSILRPVVKDTPINDHVHYDEEDDDDDDPIVRTIDVFISPALSNTLHLLQFPIEPAHRRNNNTSNSSNNKRDVKGNYNTPSSPIEAKYRPRHNMLELEYPLPHIPSHNRQLPDKMCLSSRTNASNSIGLNTHMALARMNGSGTRLDVVPLRRHVLQLRPTFDHLHDGGDGDDNDDFNNNNNNGGTNDDTAAATTKVKPIMYARKETERSAATRRSTYAHKKASEASEEWITLDVHGSNGNWSTVRKETLARVKCTDKDKTLKLAKVGHENDEDGRGAGYVKSLNYLDSSGSGSGTGENFVENLSEWALSSSMTTDDNNDMSEINDGEVISVSASERATAELAAKLAVLLQNGNGTMIPYCVLRSLFRPTKVSDEMLTVSLSSCAVLVRGNYALKSTLAKFLTSAASTGTGGGGEGGGGTTKLKLLRRLRDFILLLLSMHGMVERRRLIKAFSSSRGNGAGEHDCIIDPDTITFVLKTVARQSHNCWVAKVDDDKEFAVNFPEVAACHAMYWTKKEEMLADLINLYEDAD